MSKQVWFYETCSRCGFPFALCDALLGGALHYDTECPKCGHQEYVKVVRTASTKQLGSSPSEMPTAESAWGSFKCGCGTTGVIERDYPGEGRHRLTTYCCGCETWSRWYEDGDSGTLR